MFGDDTFLFCKANMEELQHIKHILDKYEAMSRLLINIFKSSLLFPHGLSALRRRSISQILEQRWRVLYILVYICFGTRVELGGSMF